jgi:hypothetical protein
MGENRNRSSIIFGVVLVLLGLFFLFSQFVNMVFNIRIGQYTWPLIILFPGALLYLFAFFTNEETGRALVIPGSIISAVGLLLFLQNVTGFWASWAYAWAFIFPTSVGLGQVVYGLLRNQDELVRKGWNLAKVGGVILLAGFTFFELLIGISGFRFFGLRGFCFPAVLILGGLIFILLNLRSGRKLSQPPKGLEEPASGQTPGEED